MNKKVIGIVEYFPEQPMAVRPEKPELQPTSGNLVEEIRESISLIGFGVLWKLRSQKFDNPKYQKKVLKIAKDPEQKARFKAVEALVDNLQPDDSITFGWRVFSGTWTKDNLLLVLRAITQITDSAGPSD
ncbi:MAG: hypothetical protein ACI9BD_000115 [Candidatus Marinamargulisbacteria bacterium]|jgi:hypothetical protein